jgi:hypothetical protein
LLGSRFATNSPYDSRIDNFAEVEDLDNILVTSLQDEEFLGVIHPVGALQFYNRHASDILADDLRRVFYIRKLVGAIAIKCELMQISL